LITSLSIDSDYDMPHDPSAIAACSGYGEFAGKMRLNSVRKNDERRIVVGPLFGGDGQVASEIGGNLAPRRGRIMPISANLSRDYPAFLIRTMCTFVLSSRRMTDGFR